MKVRNLDEDQVLAGNPKLRLDRRSNYRQFGCDGKEVVEGGHSRRLMWTTFRFRQEKLTSSSVRVQIKAGFAVWWWGDSDMQIVLFAAGLPSKSVLMGGAH